MPSISDPFSQRRSRAFITAASYALVCGMLMMATITIVQAMTVLAPGWQAGAWVWLSPLLALEALLSARQMRQYPALTPEWLAYRLAEWVTILLILRLVLYGVEGLDVLRADLSLPWREFASHFFSGAYWAWVVLGLLVWLVAGEFSASLEPLEVDEQAVEMERDAHAGPERQQARTRLAVLILSVGGVLLLAAALLRQDWVARLGNQPPLTAGAMNLVVYFVLGLLLLSLTRFSMLAMRWGINEYPVRTEVPQRWLAYGLLFLAVLGGIALLLPTAYAEGLLRVLAVVINFLAVVIAYLIYLISIPFLFLLNSLMHLMGEPPVTQPPAWTAPPASNDSPPVISVPPGEFSEFLLALLFWFVFLGIIYFAVRHYLSQQASAWESLRRVPILGHLLRLSGVVWAWLRGLGRGLGEIVQESFQNVRRRFVPIQAAISSGQPGYFSLRRLPPRQQVYFFYRAYLQRARQRGLPRQPAQTPQEYAGFLETQLPEVENDLNGLTGQFEEARYSQHEVGVTQVSRVRQHWARIRQALRLRQLD